MPDIIDVSFDCGAQAGFLSGAGVKTVIRYYSRDTGIPAKRLTRGEAWLFASAGIRLGIVHEARHGDQIGSFSRETGVLDGTYAREYGGRIIGQPEGTAIYFGVDVDATAAQIQQQIVPFFEGVADVFSAQTDLPRYRVGVYGSGLTCRTILDVKLAEFAWLAQSTGWSEYSAFLASGRWAMHQLMPSYVGEVDCDPVEANPNGAAIGDFFLSSLSVSNLAADNAYKVIARGGLNLRAGAGTEFAVIKLIPFETQVRAVRTVGDWTMVDLEGDGAADGFVNSHFIAPLSHS